MTEPSSDLFRQACGAPGPFRLAVDPPPGREAFRREFDRPFTKPIVPMWIDTGYRPATAMDRALPRE